MGTRVSRAPLRGRAGCTFGLPQRDSRRSRGTAGAPHGRGGLKGFVGIPSPSLPLPSRQVAGALGPTGRKGAPVGPLAGRVGLRFGGFGEASKLRTPSPPRAPREPLGIHQCRSLPVSRRWNSVSLWLVSKGRIIKPLIISSLSADSVPLLSLQDALWTKTITKEPELLGGLLLRSRPVPAV